jgi:hypothetical protein
VRERDRRAVHEIYTNCYKPHSTEGRRLSQRILALIPKLCVADIQEFLEGWIELRSDKCIAQPTRKSKKTHVKGTASQVAAL